MEPFENLPAPLKAHGEGPCVSTRVKVSILGQERVKAWLWGSLFIDSLQTISRILLHMPSTGILLPYSVMSYLRDILKLIRMGSNWRDLLSWAPHSSRPDWPRMLEVWVSGKPQSPHPGLLGVRPDDLHGIFCVSGGKGHLGTAVLLKCGDPALVE